ncbi:MAG TPA: class IV adenylate cyclase [Terriglobales bacterium]|nr:class IV adenylate cyclase [Terriglobales bacterium]
MRTSGSILPRMSAEEVEIKFAVLDVETLRLKLLRCGFREQTPRTHEMNTLYDTPEQELRSRGELLRIRKYGRDWILTHKSKGSDQRHKTRREIETHFSDGENLDAIFRALGFQPTFRYEKFRAEWSDGQGHVVVDETPIGNFAEIEGPPDWIDAIAANIGVTEPEYITKNYAVLFGEWKHRTGSDAPDMTWDAIGASRPRPLT